MPTLQDTGARTKLQKLFKALQERIPEEALRPVAMEIAKEVAMRAPTPEQEYQTMMYGGFNMAGANLIPRNSGATDEDGRVRFIKPIENYLRNYLPASFGVHGLFAGIGNIEELNQISSYSYVNASKTGTYEHAVTEPFWWAWEMGGVFTVRPKYQGNTRGRGYPLRPASNAIAWEMQKVIPARNMFTSVDLMAFIDDSLIPKIKKIVRSI